MSLPQLSRSTLAVIHLIPVIAAVAVMFWPGAVAAHQAKFASVHDTVAGIVARLSRTLQPKLLVDLSPEKLLGQLTAKERAVLAENHIRFDIDGPARIYVFHDVKFTNQPFWLPERGFSKLPGLELKIGTDATFDVWQKQFERGTVGLGVNSLTGGEEHYFVGIAPQAADATGAVGVSELYPGALRVGVLTNGSQPYIDREERLTVVPKELDGLRIIRTERARRVDGKLIRLFVATEHPSSSRPDHVILTWAGDPRTTQSIQWRTGPGVKKGAVAYGRKSDLDGPGRGDYRVALARSEKIATRTVANDQIIYWHTVALDGLEPGTAYRYAVGDGSREGWGAWNDFETAPDGARAFSFVYMGDAQNGLDRWGTLIHNAFRERPDVAFYVMAGDLVNRGAERDDWDSLFWNARGVYNRRPLVPVLGNHECQGGKPELYLKFLDLPRNGPPKIAAERVYSFEYSNALFVMLDSNLKPETQTEWLDRQLGASKAKWKFVTYHHPAYSSLPSRDNAALRNAWTPIFDRHHVDLALQGHDHAYLRTYPMKGDRRVSQPKEGTVYVVSVSGTKSYAQDQRNYTEVGFTNVATYQVLDVQVSGDRLLYRAHDLEGRIRDEFEIVK